MYTDVMVDFETLGTNGLTGYGVVALSVGAVAFNIDGSDSYDTLDNEARTFYATLPIQEQIDKGRIVTGDTIKWWFEQDRLTQRALFAEKATSVASAVYNVTQLARYATKNVRFWGNGASFDIALLDSLFDDYDLANTVSFWNVMDLRTAKLMANSPDLQIPHGGKHNALEDAKYQVLCAQEYYRIASKEVW